MSILIAIDDGHGRETAGKRSPAFSDGTVLRENAFNEATAIYLEQALLRCGFRVLQVAPEATDISLGTRVTRANQGKADAYISIHANAFQSDWNSANGIETLVSATVSETSKTYTMARAIHTRLIAATKRRDRGIKKRNDLYVLNQTEMPALLLECGFMTNQEEASLLQSSTYRKLCAEAICQGLCDFFQKPYLSQATGPSTEKPQATGVVRYQTLEELPYGKELISSLIAEGILAGEAPGRLNLSEDMLRILVILQRKGLL